MTITQTTDFDLEDFVALTAQPVRMVYPPDGGPPRGLARTPEDETRLQHYQDTIAQCTHAAWFEEQFTTLAEWIEREGGPTFDVPKYRISPRLWHGVVWHAVELLCELTEDPPDAARAARLTDEVRYGLLIEDARVGRRRRAAAGRTLREHHKPDPAKPEREARWRQRNEELLAEGVRSERERARRIVEEEREAGCHFSEPTVRDALRGRERKRR